jgi:serine protease Do
MMPGAKNGGTKALERNDMRTLRKNSLLILTLVAGVGVGAAAVTWSQQANRPGLPVAPPQTPHDLSIAFRHVAKNALPGIVWIEMQTKPIDLPDEEAAAPFNDEFFRRFFGDDPRFEQFRQLPRNPHMPPQQGRGSGFIVDPSGIILTNSHVVENADRVIVHLHDGSEVRAKSWASDPRSDVAIIRIEADKPLPAIPLGDSDLMDVGDWVLAMGNPFDVGVTVTAGIISATGRGPGINERESYLQTDAAINPGNSGGPLVNLNGEVVGINTAISTSSGGYDGVGFTIPINMARWVADQLITDGKVRRAYLGVALQELTNEIRGQLGVNVGQGALVSQVYPNTPASKAGMTELDVVLEFAGEKIKDRSHLQGIVEALEVGKAYPAVVLRDGEKISLDVTVEEMPGDFTDAMRRSQPGDEETPTEPETAKFDELGLQVEELTAELKEQTGIEARVTGVLVSAVDPDSLAAEKGLQTGDVIQKVGSKSVTTPQEYRDALQGLSIEKGIVLLVRRGDASTVVILKSND